MFFSMAAGSWVFTSVDAGILASEFIMLPLRISLNALPLKGRCVAFVNMGWCIVAMRSYAAASDGFLQPVYARMPLCSVIFCVFFSNLPALVGERLRAQDEANGRTEVMYSAAMRMLDLLCDAVVELGEGMCFIAEVPKIVGMLFLDGNTSLRGVQLTNFMTDDNKEHFTDILKDVGVGDGPDVGALNITLNDSLGNPLHLEAFYIYIGAQAAGNTRYLIGLREHHQMESRFAALPQLGNEAQLPLSALAKPAVQMSVGSASVSDVTSSAYSEDVEWAFISNRLTTTQEAKSILVENLLRQVVFDKERGSNNDLGNCCRKHAALAALQDFVQATWQQDFCYAAFFLHDAWQCTYCRVLRERRPRTPKCEVCGRNDPAGLSLEGACSQDLGSVQRSLADIIQRRSAPPPLAQQGADLELGAEEHGSGDGVPLADDSEGQLPLVTGELETSPAAKKILIRDIVKSVNFDLEASSIQSCCRMHEAVGSFLRFVSECHKHPCDHEFSPYLAWQCSICHIHCAEAPTHGRCDVCEQMMPQSGNASKPRSAYSSCSSTSYSTVDL
eukprot:TRINITY_DN20047_c0_g1_i3.p1 TRINITY_DN20047_c0_g1~~TRINITY_DN20047_c0_g1_i3.p1  ORF type:complete len:559 (+),score=62.97 TRINITY_DN20047_c0_g1_i3:153-1829(+)